MADQAISPQFQPCAACARPCLEACPVRVDADDPMAAGPAGTLECCVEHWQSGGCTVGCAARAACPVGASQRCDPPGEAVLHAEAMYANVMRRRRGPWDMLLRWLGR